MKLFIALFALLFTMRATAAVDVTNANFALKLGGDWVNVPSPDTNQFSFESKSNKTFVAVLVGPMNVPRDKLVESGRRLIDLWSQAGQKGRPGQTNHWGDKWVRLLPTKDAAQVAFDYYNNQLIFHVSGFVTQRNFLGFCVGTETQDHGFAEKTFEETLQGLKFHMSGQWIGINPSSKWNSQGNISTHP